MLTYLSSHARFAEYLEIQKIPDAGELTIFCGSLVGASLGFLWYNAHPAEMFMGDVGSLALGGAIGTVAVIIKQEILLLSIGGVFVLEALSVIIQVASFKLTGKRVFRMAPLHHHFELLGWSESKIIVRFWIAGAGVRAVFADDFEIEVRANGEAWDSISTGSACWWWDWRARAWPRRFSAPGYGATVTATDEQAGMRACRSRREAARRRCDARTWRARAADFPRTGSDRRQPRRAGEARRRSSSRARSGIPVWSEIELAWRFLRGKLVAITGSNGKTTTTSLVAHILETAGIPTLVGRKHRHAAALAGRMHRRFDRHRRGNQQLSARND